MNRIERWIITVAMAAVPPIAGLLAGWWGAVPILPERWIWAAALTGLLIGIAVDAIWLRRWVERASSFGWWFWVALYGFFSVCIYGFFMGVPVFNAVLALPAGVLVSFRLARLGANAETVARANRRACAFTTSALAFFCAASAYLALRSSSTASDLEGMLGLPFEVTPGMIVGLIVLGGAALLMLEWGVTALVLRSTYAYALRQALPARDIAQ